MNSILISTLEENMNYISRISFTQANKRVTDEFIQYFHKKYKNSYRKMEWNDGIAYIWITTNTSEYDEILKELEENDIKVFEDKTIEFSKKDLDNAEYLEINPKFEAINPYEEYEAFDEYKKGCGFFTKQIKDLMIRKKDLGKKDILKSYDEEIIVSLRLWEILKNEKLKGLEFRPVYTKGEIEPVAYQVIIGNQLPKLQSKTRMDIAINKPQFGFVSYTMESYDFLYYSHDDFKNAKDFNITTEYFGIGLYPRPLRIVSQKVRQVLLKEKIKGIEFEPIYFEE
jgi:hypothetical protein